MSIYSLKINNDNFKDEVKEVVDILDTGDCINIYVENNEIKNKVSNIIKEEGMKFKHKIEGNREYIIAKK